jgi:hypothetical protein
MGFLGGLLGTAFSALAGHWSAKQNAKISRDQWAYQQSNAHQLEVQDLKNAGLNPILSASNSQMASMPQVSDNGAASASANVLSSALQASVSKQNAKLQAEVEGQRIDNERKRLELDKERYGFQNRLDASQIGLNASQISLNNSSKSLMDAQSRFVDIQGRELVRLNDAQISSIFSHMQNESALTSAQISEIESKKSVNNAQIKALEAQAKDAIEHSNLTYWQKLDIITDINSASRKLQNLTDQQRYEYLSQMPGNIQNQTGFGLTLMNPFTNFGMRAGSGYVGSRKN